MKLNTIPLDKTVIVVKNGTARIGKVSSPLLLEVEETFPLKGDFEAQAHLIKELFYKYNAQRVIINDEIELIDYLGQSNGDFPAFTKENELYISPIGRFL